MVDPSKVQHAGYGVELAASCALVIWPDHKWIAIAGFLIGLVLVFWPWLQPLIFSPKQAEHDFRIVDRGGSRYPKPPPKRKLVVPVLSLSVFTVVAVVLINLEGGPPTAVVVLRTPLVSDNLPFIVANRVSHIEARILNNGPEVARNVKWHFIIKTIPTPQTTVIETQQMDELWVPLNATVSAVSPVSIDPGEGHRKPMEFFVLENHANRINSGAVRFYVMSRATWDDSAGSHETEKCWWLQKPNNDPRPVWHGCQSHNF